MRLFSRTIIRGFPGEWWENARQILGDSLDETLTPLTAQLRSPELQPTITLGEYCTGAERQRAVGDVIQRRSHRLATLGLSPSIGRDEPGRLLLHWPHENVADGASQVYSKGFVDLYDTPPWDTWVHYSEGQLTAWVPAALEELAQRAIDANPMECIRWAD